MDKLQYSFFTVNHSAVHNLHPVSIQNMALRRSGWEMETAAIYYLLSLPQKFKRLHYINVLNQPIYNVTANTDTI